MEQGLGQGWIDLPIFEAEFCNHAAWHLDENASKLTIWPDFKPDAGEIRLRILGACAVSGQSMRIISFTLRDTENNHRILLGSVVWRTGGARQFRRMQFAAEAGKVRIPREEGERSCPIVALF